MKLLERSFAGGEITPELFGRIDLTKFQTGLQLCKNFWVLPHGPVENRPGTEFVMPAFVGGIATPRLLPFSFSAEDTVLVVIGDGNIEFVVDGAPLFDLTVTVNSVTVGTTTTVNATAHGLTTGARGYLTGFSQDQLFNRFVKVTVLDANTFTVQLPTFSGSTQIDTTGAATTGGTFKRIYSITSPYPTTDLATLRFVQSADVMTITHPSHQPRELRRSGATNWALATIAWGPSITTPAAGPTVVATGTGTAGLHDNRYAVTALKAGTLEESLISPLSTNVVNDLSLPANYNTLTMPAEPPDTVRFNVYKQENGILAFIGQAAVGSTLIDDNINPDQLTTPPALFEFAAGLDMNSAGYYPRAVGYIEGRRAFGGSNNLPQSFLMTRSGTESNTTFSVPQQDDDLIAGRIVSNEVHRVLHFVAVREPLMLALDGEWTLSPVNSDTLTPSTTAAKPVSSEGSSDVRPVVAGTNVLFVHSSGRRVIELKFVDGFTRYNTFDLSLLAAHLFRGRTLVDSAYARVPQRMAFFPRDDGTMLGVTYQPEHEVTAWHQHATANGAIERVAAIREGPEDAVYVCVKRTINGVTWHYIERLASRYFVAQKEGHFVDAGIQNTNQTTTTVQGLTHLIGETVKVLVDGATHPDRVVSSNGTITLQETPLAAAHVHVGYGIVADMQTLPLVIESRGVGASGQAHTKNVSEVYLRVYQSSLFKAGPNFTKLREYPARAYEPYGSPPALKSAELRLAIDGLWAQDGAVAVRHTDPLPLTVLSMILDVETGR